MHVGRVPRPLGLCPRKPLPIQADSQKPQQSATNGRRAHTNDRPVGAVMHHVGTTLSMQGPGLEVEVYPQQRGGSALCPKVLMRLPSQSGQGGPDPSRGMSCTGPPVMESTANHHAATRVDTSRQSQLIMRAKRVISVILSGPPSPALRTRLAWSVRQRLRCESLGCLGAATGNDLRTFCHSRGTGTMLS